MRVTTGDVYLQVHVCCNLLLMNSYGIFRLLAWPCVTMLHEVATYALPSDRGYEPHPSALCIVPCALLPESVAGPHGLPVRNTFINFGTDEPALRVTPGDVYVQGHVCCNLTLINMYAIFGLVPWPCALCLVAWKHTSNDFNAEPSA